jgi:phosphoribosylanthranilate isomerase
VSFWIKICGVRSSESAAAARDGGADLVGFNFVSSSARFVQPALAAELARSLGPHTRAVGVFVDPTPEQIDRVLGEVPLAFIQLHGSEAPERVQLLADRAPVIKALPVDAAFTLARLLPYRGLVAAYLLDAPRPGSGQGFDRAQLAGLAAEAPILIAGGLHAANVAQAIEELRPGGVDTASGIEREGCPDPIRIAEFCRAARAAAQRYP